MKTHRQSRGLAQKTSLQVARRGEENEGTKRETFKHQKLKGEWGGRHGPGFGFSLLVHGFVDPFGSQRGLP